MTLESVAVASPLLQLAVFLASAHTTRLLRYCPTPHSRPTKRLRLVGQSARLVCRDGRCDNDRAERLF